MSDDNPWFLLVVLIAINRYYEVSGDGDFGSNSALTVMGHLQQATHLGAVVSSPARAVD